MDKKELVNLTLRQLNDKFHSDPEHLRLEDPTIASTSFTGPTILWQYKVKVDGVIIQDPNNAPRTIIVTYSRHLQQLSCYIFMREENTLSGTIMSDGVVHLDVNWPMFNLTLWRFKALCNKLSKRMKDEQHFDYVQKLTSIFPGTFEDDIFN